MKRFARDVGGYDEYKKTQITRSAAKWANPSFDQWVFMKVLATALPRATHYGSGKQLRPLQVGCMGIRNGNEYSALLSLKKALTCLDRAEIHGIDINPEVVKVGPNCHAEDFNKLPASWTGRFDLIYSNSLDHAFDIKATLEEWRRVMRNDRYLLVELADGPKTCATDLYAFEEADVGLLFGDKSKWEIRHVWREYGQQGFFNVLVRVIK